MGNLDLGMAVRWFIFYEMLVPKWYQFRYNVELAAWQVVFEGLFSVEEEARMESSYGKDLVR